MPQNLELKARIPSIGQAAHVARRLHARAKGILHQRDIYYKIPRGRLKLRMINRRSAELIFYSRPNKKGSRYSKYAILPVADMALVHSLCTKAFGTMVEVEKQRRLFLYKNSRIHVDDVRGLGTFIEFEVLVLHGKRQAVQLMANLSEEFQIHRRAVVSGSYSDMLMKKKEARIRRRI